MPNFPTKQARGPVHLVRRMGEDNVSPAVSAVPGTVMELSQ
jgi:hypothetical protein